MRAFIWAALASGSLTFSLTAEKGQSANVLVVEVTADEIAKEFKQDPATAKKKYNPTPPKDHLAGTLVKITGVVEDVAGRNVYLKNLSGLKVEVQVANPPNNGAQFTATGSFTRFKDQTIVIDSK